MERPQFRREFKLEAVKLVKDRGVAVLQASRGIDVYHAAAQMGEGGVFRLQVPNMLTP
jgi:transposase-like protein